MASEKKKNGTSHSALEFPTPKLMPITALRKNPHNVRTHSKKQIGQIARSIEEFDFAVPIVADGDGVILAGHGRLDAALQLGLKEVLVVSLSGLSEARKRAFMLADN
jgi:ParB-like chromosome segregation protein Spo0J